MTFEEYFVASIYCSKFDIKTNFFQTFVSNFS